MKVGDKVRSTTQCRFCRQHGPCESTVTAVWGNQHESDMAVMLDHNNPQGQLCEGSGKIAAFQGDWAYKADGKTRKTFSAECPLCHDPVECVGSDSYMIPTHYDKKGHICKPSYFPKREELGELPERAKK